ncbi:S-adenosyl-L-methionine-dependent methyltransferase [Pavlovales sp. CCMP2436]|nr:S-adenosyl-L-methionine-dependent methyltransferase [Pavlovales sp. CCMP2436]|mmetsp:Transcript_36853/g.85385  ORF Transcript_36853/g.85385 Transcript_36853/m.85385 type:complete len:234 (+) Transcript_36853:79-780(+)
MGARSHALAIFFAATMMSCSTGAASASTGVPCAINTGPMNAKAEIVVTHAAAIPYRICCRRNQLVDRVIKQTGKWPDCDHLPAMLGGSVPGKRLLFVDVGANIGACSLLMAAHGHRIVSFEPVPQTFRALAAGFAANNFTGSATTLVNAAASTEVGVSTISTKLGNAGHSFTGGRGAVAADASGYEVFDIETTTLDTVVHEHVHLMKIDTQGHELKALKGARELMRRHGIDRI